MPWCTDCNGYLVTGREHRCPTAWSALVSLDKDALRIDEDGLHEGYEYTVHAWSADRAAEKAAKLYDTSDGEFACAGEDETLYVKLCKLNEESPSYCFAVSGEMEPTYNAEAEDDEG